MTRSVPLVVAALFAALFAVGCRHEPATTELTGCLATGEHVDLPVEQGGSVGFRVAFDGYGCNSLARRDGAAVLHLRAGQALRHSETHAALALGPQMPGKVNLACGITTVSQCRLGSPPNNHEVGWLVWGYRDNDHFYYLIAKPNGWELGKREPSFTGGQQFLATDARRSYPIGERHELRIKQSASTIDAWIDGEHVTTFTDPFNAYIGGRVGFYCEDSDVYFDALSLSGN